MNIISRFSLDDCTLEERYAVIRFLVAEGENQVKTDNIYTMHKELYKPRECLIVLKATEQVSDEPGSVRPVDISGFSLESRIGEFIRNKLS